ncbi:MAG: HAMP domain-containing sensor histidine kinase [Patescibacteria group bacterium]
MPSLVSRLNIAAECRALKIPLLHCPPLLFIMMGFATIAAMAASYIVASRYTDQPEIAALIVSFVAGLFFIIGNLVIRGFNEVAEANRMKSEFISIISHQLGTPLSIFRMTLGLIERKQTAEGIAEHLPTLTDTADRMIRLVNALLEVNRIEASHLVLKSEAVDADAVTRGLIDDFKSYATAHKVRIAYHAPDHAPTVQADREKLDMALQNLLDNAVRYTLDGGTVTVTLSAGQGVVRWDIVDQGMGIPAAQHPYIFQKFFRGENGQARDTHGSGIGLYIAKAIVEASGGTIGFISKEGKGTTFWFTLPVAENKTK